MGGNEGLWWQLYLGYRGNVAYKTFFERRWNLCSTKFKKHVMGCWLHLDVTGPGAVMDTHLLRHSCEQIGEQRKHGIMQHYDQDVSWSQSRALLLCLNILNGRRGNKKWSLKWNPVKQIVRSKSKESWSKKFTFDKWISSRYK